ncbi:hypothetical protein CEXT_740901 [Caerostris extrusa]|uniref:Uncharacterized protein n=1 Tax=Caerostris extrusa TaxID=172846 RepID=A0AAV4VRZ3_CAEEX|nr:hypothetical protein CEXT_740901 [Caerostris extrusa]
MIDGSECGIVSHLQLIFGSLHYGETSGTFPKPLTISVFQVMGPSRGKEALARFIREMVCNSCLFCGQESFSGNEEFCFQSWSYNFPT